MKLVDANVLLYAVNEDAHHHDEARRWLDGALSGTEVVGFAWIVLLAFMRLSTSATVFSTPLDLAQAASIVERWLGQPAAIIVQPSGRHLALLRGLLAETGAASNLVNDAHLAALALEHGATVTSYDGDFSRFAGVRRERPAA